jgi:hypothetical protein
MSVKPFNSRLVFDHLVFTFFGFFLAVKKVFDKEWVTGYSVQKKSKRGLYA